ncbi:MAG: hypothetical protein AB7F96_16555 [Beijerinckiaceae bacterium]
MLSTFWGLLSAAGFVTTLAVVAAAAAACFFYVPVVGRYLAVAIIAAYGGFEVRARYDLTRDMDRRLKAITAQRDSLKSTIETSSQIVAKANERERQAAEKAQTLSEKLREYERELEKRNIEPTPEPPKPGVKVVYRNVCRGIEPVDADRLRRLGAGSK